MTKLGCGSSLPKKSRTQISEALVNKYKISKKGTSAVFTVDARSDDEARECAIRFFGELIFSDACVQVVHVRSSGNFSVKKARTRQKKRVER
jgi:hypothetical protein